MVHALRGEAVELRQVAHVVGVEQRRVGQHHVCLLYTSITRDWVRFGDPDDVVTEQSLGETYGVDVRIVKEHTCDCGTLKGCIPVVEFVADRAGAPKTAPGAAGESSQGAGGPPSRTIRRRCVRRVPPSAA